MNQNPWPLLPGVFSAESGVVVFDSALKIISLADIKFVIFAALEDIDVIYNYFFGIPH